MEAVEALSPLNATEHLRRRALIAADETVSLEALGGGVSNVVLRYTPEHGRPGVLKQPLHRLRVPFAWICPLERVVKEMLCLDVLARNVDPGTVPAVLDFDSDRFVLAMTCADAGSRNWKEDLLRGRLDPNVARAAGALLRHIHDTVRLGVDETAALDDPAMLVPLRIDPYYRPAAAKNPVVASEVLAAASRLTSERRALVLGDFVPKNILVRPNGALTIIDFEVAHLGDPAYDVASCLNHLLLKAIAFRENRTGLTDLARVFWQSYGDGAAAVDEPGTLLHLGALQLARVDGLSPAEYLDDASRATARAVARAVLQTDLTTVIETIAYVERLP